MKVFFFPLLPELLSEAPKELFASDETVPKTIHGWSLIESNSRREPERVKSLYPHDAAKHVAPPT